jgi:hypothetical protein
VRHGPTVPGVMVHPEPAIHGVDHSVTAPGELDPPFEQRDGISWRRNFGERCGRTRCRRLKHGGRV